MIKLQFLLLTSFVAVIHSQINYYVSISGSDSNSGTETSPFRSVLFAYNQAPVGKATIINILPGTYGSESMFTLRSNTQVTLQGAYSTAVINRHASLSQLQLEVVFDCNSKNPFIESENNSNLQWVTLNIDGIRFQNCPNGAIFVLNYPTIPSTMEFSITNSQVDSGYILIQLGQTPQVLQGFNCTLRNVNFTNGLPLTTSLVLRFAVNAVVDRCNFDGVKSALSVENSLSLWLTNSVFSNSWSASLYFVLTMLIDNLVADSLSFINVSVLGLVWDMGMGGTNPLAGVQLTVSNILFDSNFAGATMVSWAAYQQASVTSVIARDCSAGSSIIGSSFMGNMVITGLSVTNSKVSNGSCVEIDWNEHLLISGSLFSGCRASMSTVMLKNTPSTFQNVIMTNNVVGYGGCAGLTTGSRLQCNNCTCLNSKATGPGGGYLVKGGSINPTLLVLVGGMVENTVAQTGGAIVCEGQAKASFLKNPLFSNNTSIDKSPAIDCN